jgi:nucleoside-diphosphate-sugar epimerase
LIDPKIEISYDEERERPPKSEVMELTCDNTLARELLDWNPQYTIDAGLKKTIAFIKDNLSFYKPEKYSI